MLGCIITKNTPRRYFSLSVVIVRGFGILFVAFPKVIPVLSVDLSVDEVLFSDVSEQRLFYNQPVEVRVDPRVLSSSKVNSPGG